MGKIAFVSALMEWPFCFGENAWSLLNFEEATQCYVENKIDPWSKDTGVKLA